MLNHEKQTLQLDKLVPGGQAIGTLENGKKAFVWGGLPNELVEIEITKNKAKFVEGITTKVLEHSPYRIKPKDDCYLSTSPWQIMDYDFELEQKALLVQEAFRQQLSLCHSELVSESGLKIPKQVQDDGRQYFYRNKMEYSLYWDNNKNLIDLAFHKRGTHIKTPITSSSIERPEILVEAQRTIADLNTHKEQARKYQSLLIRCDQVGQVSSALFENNKSHPHMQPLADELLGYKYSYSPNGFFQINLPVYRLALQKIKEYITTDRVVDMYAGVGTIGLSVARDKDLVLVETDKHAYSELTANVGRVVDQPISARLPIAIHAKTEDALNYITADATIILDPPRAGLHVSVIMTLTRVLPPTIIYLSCNPTTQARDIAPLLKRYKINLCQPYNFFPRTPHIENLVILELK
ncbi:RsmD family RNA methyltransferase [Candidatus Saccharibacteria bacterium]|nr:RsmD family RNA methyltransferase [Candidatus Saccharibacteria bacterium]